MRELELQFAVSNTLSNYTIALIMTLQIEVGRSGGLEALLRICTGSQSQQQHTLQHPQQLGATYSDSTAALTIAASSDTTAAAAAVADSNSQQQQLLLPALWALRTAVHNCKPNQDKLLRLGGVEALVQLLAVSTLRDSPQQESDTPTLSHTAAVAAAALTALTAAVRGHERACRRLLRIGLDALIDLAEAAGLAQQQVNLAICMVLCVGVFLRY
jgi:hypothetical protein